MVKIKDGPAKGTVLHLQNAPRLLRVVIDPSGKVDALDCPDDTPDPKEAVYVYRRDGDAGQAIICSRGKGCRHAAVAEYVLNDLQPEPVVMRDSEQWNLWMIAR
jgi:hypothetical protein